MNSTMLRAWHEKLQPATIEADFLFFFFCLAHVFVVSIILHDDR
jgi:hypothetical protein